MENLSSAIETLKLLQSWSLWLLGIHIGAIGFLAIYYLKSGLSVQNTSEKIILAIVFICFGFSVLAADFVQGGLPSVASRLLFLKDMKTIPNENIFEFNFPKNLKTSIIFWIHFQTIASFLGFIFFSIILWIKIKKNDLKIEQIENIAV